MSFFEVGSFLALGLGLGGACGEGKNERDERDYLLQGVFPVNNNSRCSTIHYYALGASKIAFHSLE